MKYFSQLGQKFADERKGWFYYALNLGCLALAGAAFFSALYVYPDAVARQLADPLPNTHPQYFGPAFFLYDGAQRIAFLKTALYYQGWIFGLLLLRNLAMLMRRWWSLYAGVPCIVAAFVLAVLFYNWATLLDEWSLMLYFPYAFGGATLLMVITALVELVVATLLALGKSFGPEK